ncbi:MAG: elongation factor G [Gammaproteobacteria bacterium]|nr:elongation factor G [Gammaproteobacteria bacterium]
MAYSTSDIRNVVLLGQAGAGKTTLSEALLFTSGTIPSKGEISRKNTVSDQDVLEKQHQRSLTSSILSFDHNSTRLNVIDTPGYSDFVGTAISAIHAVETAVIVINAQNGVETMTRRFIEWARDSGVCVSIVVNKIDAVDVEFGEVYSAIQDEFGSECLAVNLPVNGGTAVVDCLTGKEGDSDLGSVEDAHVSIADQIVEVDDELMEEYLETGELPEERIAPVFKQAMLEGHLIPVFFTSAEKDIGVTEFLAQVAELFANPTEGQLPEFFQDNDGEKEQLSISADPDKSLVGHVFKIAFDPFIGKLGVFRVYQGQLNKDTPVYIDDARKPVKFSNLYQMMGKQHTDVSEAIAGDIRGIAKIDEINQNSVLLTEGSDNAITMQSLRTPFPMVGLAIGSANRGDEQKVAEALQKIAVEDPCIALSRNPAANETIMRGMGDLHLRVALERMKEVYSVEVTTSIPTVDYRETVTKLAEGHCRHKKQTGGAGQFGEVYLRVEPLPRGDGFEFVDNVVGGVIPSQFIPAVEKGIRQVLTGGAFAGFPLQDIRVTVYDGKHHSVDSKEIAFITAGKKAFIDAVSKAGPIVLEPIADVTVTVPSGNMGDIAGELSSRRGRISDTDSLPSGAVSITGAAPLAEMSDFQARLNAISGGEGTFVMEFGSYEPAPMDIQKKLSAEFQHPEDD